VAVLVAAGVEVVLHPREVGADTEGLVARARDDDDPHIAVGGDAREERRHLGVHLRADCVAPLGAIQADPEDPGFAQLGAEVLEVVVVAHGSPRTRFRCGAHHISRHRR
jgi:hypothetical protein